MLGTGCPGAPSLLLRAQHMLLQPQHRAWALPGARRGTVLSALAAFAGLTYCSQWPCGITVTPFIEEDTVALAQGDTDRTGHGWQSQDLNRG